MWEKFQEEVFQVRLIDADAIVALIREIDPTDYGTMYDYLSHGTAKDVIGDVIHLVQADAPTIDAEPVRRGRWIGWHGDYMTRKGAYKHFHYYECSECSRCTAVKSDFCPRCGAKMDAKEA